MVYLLVINKNFIISVQKVLSFHVNYSWLAGSFRWVFVYTFQPLIIVTYFYFQYVQDPSGQKYGRMEEETNNMGQDKAVCCSIKKFKWKYKGYVYETKVYFWWLKIV